MIGLLEAIAAGANLFTRERSLYFINRANNLMKIVEEQSDANFYNKDMNAKARAERSLQRDTEKLRLEFISEAKKAKK